MVSNPDPSHRLFNLSVQGNPGSVIKVTYLIPTLDQSGAEKQLTLLATHLPRDEFDVRVITLTREGPYAAVLADHGIPVENIGKRGKFDPFAIRRLKQAIARSRPDILHTWLFAANAYGRFVAGGSASPTQVVVSERCVDVWKASWQTWVDRLQQHRMACLIGNSQSVADFYAAQGVERERIAVIPNGIELPPPNSGFRRPAPVEWNLPANARIVGYVGRLAKQKRVQDLVWATELLRQIDRRAYFIIIGDGPEAEAMKRYASETGCEEHVRFVGHLEDVQAVLPCFDVFWLASDFEGQSNSIMEAMACGIPVVASDIPPNRELVIDGETGFLVGVGDSVGFAQFAERVMADEQLRQRLGQAGRQRMAEEFSVQRMVDSHVALYRSVLGDRGSDPTTTG